MTLSYPSAAAFPIAYNVPTNGLLPYGNLSGEAVKYVASISPLKRLTLAEADRVHGYADRAIRTFIKESQLPKFTELRDVIWSLANVGDPNGDRTLPVGFDYAPMVDGTFIEFLQSDILSRYPEWRILHCEDSNALDLNLAVYPDAISVGHDVFTDDFSISIAKWRRDVLRHREPQDGPLRRQINAVQNRLLEKPRGYWRNYAPLVVMAFDNDQGDQSVQAVWLLVRGATGFDVGIDADSLEEGNSYPVRNDGRIGRLMGDTSPSGLWLRQIILPKRSLHHIGVVSVEPENVVNLNVDKFIRDADLKMHEEGNTK